MKTIRQNMSYAMTRLGNREACSNRFVHFSHFRLRQGTEFPDYSRLVNRSDLVEKHRGVRINAGFLGCYVDFSRILLGSRRGGNWRQDR